MKTALTWKNVIIAFFAAAFVLSGFLMTGDYGIAMQEMKSDKKIMHQKAHSLFQNKCLGCHVSVADPEKPGRTRDDWHLVVQVMHKYGMDLSVDESEMIIDLLYDLRKGMEREAG